MIPKQKSEDLIDKYRTYIRIGKYDNNVSEDEIYLAKQCALIAVDEIIEALLEYDNRNATYELQNMDRDFNYWEQVKQEIEKL